jgi:hypothetical protein
MIALKEPVRLRTVFGNRDFPPMRVAEDWEVSCAIAA